jgi:[CysO sulfur-carrier protein]-S-L-cysteine hydrolase
MDFLLLNAAKEAMIAHARDDAPLECCGLLLGAQGVVEEAVRARNLRHSRTAYLVDPADHFAAIRRARKEGRTIVGAYHSHPRSPAVPSPVDLQEAQFPDFLYVIVSLADPRTPDVRGYRLTRDAFIPATLVG